MCSFCARACVHMQRSMLGHFDTIRKSPAFYLALFLYILQCIKGIHICASLTSNVFCYTTCPLIRGNVFL